MEKYTVYCMSIVFSSENGKYAALFVPRMKQLNAFKTVSQTESLIALIKYAKNCTIPYGDNLTVVGGGLWPNGTGYISNLYKWIDWGNQKIRLTFNRKLIEKIPNHPWQRILFVFERSASRTDEDVLCALSVQLHYEYDYGMSIIKPQPGTRITDSQSNKERNTVKYSTAAEDITIVQSESKLLSWNWMEHFCANTNLGSMLTFNNIKDLYDFSFFFSSYPHLFSLPVIIFLRIKMIEVRYLSFC